MHQVMKDSKDLASSCRIGVDVGGTFTDIVLVDGSDGAVTVTKRLNRHEDRSETVVEGLCDLLEDAEISPENVGCISHGTTITTNAVIERRGARTALITNRNFRDILEIGRFARPERLIYRVHEDRPQPLVPRHLRLGVTCRIDRNGEVVTDLDQSDLKHVTAELARENVESVAVCFLFSFLNPVHEEQVRNQISADLPGVDIVLSSEILREFREFPRTATTVVAAYVAPILRTYIRTLLDRMTQRGLTPPLYIFQSNGGVARPEVVMRNPAHTLLSGPAGAVVGATALCQQIGQSDFVTMDMGGTSLDVCLVREAVAEVTTTREIAGFPVAVPMLDVHTIGAGGGSILRVDEVGRVKVGPDSMGARPGPACYGLGGTLATLTDVHLVMGVLDAERFAGGRVTLDPEAARRAVRHHIADPLELPLEEAATGVYRVATNQMAEAVRTVAVESGSDLRDYALLAFGGGGPMHAAAVARELGIRRIIIPRHPGLFSAWGIATADFSHDYVQSVVRPMSGIPFEDVLSIVSELGHQATRDLDTEGIASERRDLLPALDLRYLGQATEIAVPLLRTRDATADLEDIVERFHQLHDRLYSYRVADEPIELVNVRLRAIGRTGAPLLPGSSDRTHGPGAVSRRRMLHPETGHPHTVPVWQRENLGPGVSDAGPLLIEEASSTTVVPDGFHVHLDHHDNIIMDRADNGG